MKRYEVEAYTTEKGEIPFQEWLSGLKDEVAKTKLTAKLDRASFGLFGDCKTIKGAKGIFEMREHYGSGYRIFYSVIENKIVLLLAGSIKRDQKKTIAKAKEYLADYERKQSHD
jgi:putative addiction module killer protein